MKVYTHSNLLNYEQKNSYKLVKTFRNLHKKTQGWIQHDLVGGALPDLVGGALPALVGGTHTLVGGSTSVVLVLTNVCHLPLQK